MFKKIIATSLAACMLLTTLTACGNRNPQGSSSNVSGTENTSSVSTSSSLTSGSTSGDNVSTASGTTNNVSGTGSGTQNTGNVSGTNQTVSGTSSGAVPSGKKLIKVWWNTTDESMLAAADDFQKANKDIYIRIESGDSNVARLKAAISAGIEPNLIQLDHVYITALGNDKLILDLNKFGAKSLKSKYISSCWNAVSYDGKVYGLPHDGNTIALMYNKTMFDAANQKAPKTYDQLLNVGRALKKYIDANQDKGYQYAFTSPFYSGNADQGRLNWAAFVYFFWLWRNGGEILNSSNTRAAFNSEAGVNALTQLKKLVTEGICAPNEYMEAQFYNGTIGMIEMGNWSLPTLTSTTKNADFGVAMMPQLKKGVPQYSGLGLYAIGITKNTKYPQEAFNFIKYYTTNTQYQIQYGQQYNQLPVVKSALNSKIYKSSMWQLYITQYALSKSRPGVDNWDEMERIIATAVSDVIKGAKQPRDALESAAAQINALLKAN